MTSTPQNIHLDDLYALIDKARPVGASPAFKINTKSEKEIYTALIERNGSKSVDPQTSLLVRGLQISPAAYDQLAPKDAAFLNSVLKGQILGRVYDRDIPWGNYRDEYKASPIVVAKDTRALELHGASKVFNVLNKTGEKLVLGGVCAAVGTMAVAVLGLGLSACFSALALSACATTAGTLLYGLSSSVGGSTVRASVLEAGRADGPWMGGSAFKAELKEKLRSATQAPNVLTSRPS